MRDELGWVGNEEGRAVDARGGIGAKAMLRFGGSYDADVPERRKPPLDVFFTVVDLGTRRREEFWLGDGLWVRSDNIDGAVADV